MSDKDILDALPSRQETYDWWIIAKLLSEKNTESLGFFEVIFSNIRHQLEANVSHFYEGTDISTTPNKPLRRGYCANLK